MTSDDSDGGRSRKRRRLYRARYDWITGERKGDHGTSAYLEHLTEGDVRLLARIMEPGESEEEASFHLRSEPASLERALEERAVYEHLFSAHRERDPLLVASPFLVFAVSVHRAALELQRSTFVSEWVGPNERLPVLDAGTLSDFLASPQHRLFLAELLASYTHVASGALWVRSTRGWRRQRFSELDPVRLAALLEVVSEEERPGVYRRLGDLALFLTGVFPDHTSTSALGPVAMQRLLRAGARVGLERDAEGGSLALLERLGERWYRAACAEAGRPWTRSLSVVASVAARYRDARRALNFIAERYLFPHRNRWFAGPAV